MAEEKTVTLTQAPGERLAIEHSGTKAPVHHVIESSEKHPIVHMVCWDEEEPCAVEVRGQVALVGDEKSPVRVRMTHTFENPHVQEHRIEPVDHSLKVTTRLAEPIHHALQMRTPLELRFCNPWHVASDYMVELRLADNRVFSLRLTGATIATPQPCPDDKPCP